MSHFLTTFLGAIATLLLVVVLPMHWMFRGNRFTRATARQIAEFLGIALAAGLLLRLPAVAIVAFVGLLALALAKVLSHFALQGTTYRRVLNPPRLFPGDRGELVTQLDNEKILPLAWVSVEDPVDFTAFKARSLNDYLKLEDESQGRSLSGALTATNAIGPFQRVERKIAFEARRRGVYRLGPVKLTSGDPFGMFPVERLVGDEEEIIVYPRVYQPEEIGVSFNEAIGEFIKPREPFEDPILLAGSREYRPGDPLRRIHWKATARTGDLQVRVHDPSTTAHIMIVLNLHTSAHVWEGIDPARMESTIDLGASLALWILKKGVPVGVHSNGIRAERTSTPRLAPTSNPSQAALVLEHLARLVYPATSAEHILTIEGRRLGRRGSIVFVTPTITAPLIRVLTSPPLARRVSVVYSGRVAAPMVPGLPVHLAVPQSERLHAAS